MREADDAFVLDVDSGFADTVIERLERFKLRTKATIEALPEWRCLALRGPRAHDVATGIAADWPGLPGVDLIGADVAVPAGVSLVAVEAYEVVRIEAGVPRMGRELTEQTIPAEATGVVERSVSFTKGCYTGQELVARIDSRGGNVARHLRGIEFSDAERTRAWIAAARRQRRKCGNGHVSGMVSPHQRGGWVGLRLSQGRTARRVDGRRRESAATGVRRTAVLLTLAALGVTSCSGSGVIKIKDPGPVPDVTTTTATDFGQIGLKGVGGKTATTVALEPGGASLTGTVVGPDGPVPGATVHVERLVGSASAAKDVVTQPDGTWALPTILGGRYRVRAWKAPELALTKPEIFYLQSSEPKTLALRVDRYTGAAVTVSIAPSPPVVRQPTNLFVLLAQKTVDDQGVVRATPVPGASLELQGSGFQLETANPATTDTNGIAQWRLHCSSIGQATFAVSVVNAGSFPLSVPPCVEEGYVPPTTTTPGTAVRRTTSSTRRAT